jgi:hypothetical protein
MADVAHTRAEEKLDSWKEQGATDLVMFRLERANLTATLRERRNDAQLLTEKDAMDNIINSLMEERKNLEADKKAKKILSTAKKALDELYLKRAKVDRPMRS